MNHKSTIAALREIADTIESYPTTSPGSALRLRDIATTLERQGGALDQAALAERLEAAAQAINAAAERLEALTVAPPDLDVAGFGEELTGAVRRILTDDYREIIARADRPEPWPDVIGERLAKASIPATTDTVAAFLEGHAFQRAMAVPTIKIAPDVYDNLEREHAAALRGEHNAPPPVVTSRAVTVDCCNPDATVRLPMAKAQAEAAGFREIGGVWHPPARVVNCPDGKPCGAYVACVNAGGCTRE